MGIWSGHVPSAAIVQTERHWSDLRIDDHHSLRWTQANVDDHCTLEVNKKHLLACWVWNKNFVESNAIIENNLLCFWGWKTLKACFIVNIHDANVCSLFNLGGQFKTMQHWALSKQTKRVLNVVKIKWKKVEIKLNKLEGCLILSKLKPLNSNLGSETETHLNQENPIFSNIDHIQLENIPAK